MFVGVATKLCYNLVSGIEKRSGVPSHQTGSRAADTTKIFDGKFLVAEDSRHPDGILNDLNKIYFNRMYNIHSWRKAMRAGFASLQELYTFHI